MRGRSMIMIKKIVPNVDVLIENEMNIDEILITLNDLRYISKEEKKKGRNVIIKNLKNSES